MTKPLFTALAGAAAVAVLNAPGAGAAPLVVQLDWTPNAQYAGVLVAKEKGYYAEAGIDVTIVPIDSKSMDPIGPVLAKPAAVGFADGFLLLKARRDGMPVKAFGTIMQASPLALISLAKSGITSVSQLAGRTVAVQSYDHAQLEIFLRFNHLGLDDVHIKDIGGQTVSLSSGAVDAQLGYAVDEAVALEQMGLKLNLMPAFANGCVAYSQVYFTREDFFAGNAGLLRAFLEATNRGWRDAFLYPAATARMIVRRYLPAADVDGQKRSLLSIQAYMTHESDQLGMMRRSTWEASASAFRVDPSVTDTLVDYSILNDVYGKLR